MSSKVLPPKKCQSCGKPCWGTQCRKCHCGEKFKNPSRRRNVKRQMKKWRDSHPKDLV